MEPSCFRTFSFWFKIESSIVLEEIEDYGMQEEKERPKRALENPEDNGVEKEKKRRQDFVFESFLDDTEQLVSAFRNGAKQVKIVCQGKSEDARFNSAQLRLLGKEILNIDDVIQNTGKGSFNIIAKSEISALKALEVVTVSDQAIKKKVLYNSCTTQYIVKRVGKEIPLSEIAEDASLQGISVNKITRFTKKGEKTTPISTILISELGDVKRRKIKIGHEILRVQNFIPKPRICFRCLEFGHFQADCKAEDPRCEICGENHATKECTNIKDQPECFRCGAKDHSAYDFNCPVVKKESVSLNKAKTGRSPGTTVEKSTINRRSYSEVVRSKEGGAGNQATIGNSNEDLINSIKELKSTVETLANVTVELIAKLSERTTESEKAKEQSPQSVSREVREVIKTEIGQPIQQIKAAVKLLATSLETYIRKTDQGHLAEAESQEDQSDAPDEIERIDSDGASESDEVTGTNQDHPVRKDVDQIIAEFKEFRRSSSEELGAQSARIKADLDAKPARLRYCNDGGKILSAPIRAPVVRTPQEVVAAGRKKH